MTASIASASTSVVHDASTPTSLSATRKIRAKRIASRGHLSRDAKALKTRIRRLWQDPRQPELNRSRHDSKIATSILQPPEPPLTNLGKPTLRSPTSIATLGEPALSTIALGAGPASNATSHLTQGRKEPLLSESTGILISKLLNLSNTFTGAIKTLCEQQNEKVLRFDDDMILELLTRWEQEAGNEDEHGPDNSSSTSLVTLGTTNALERYQITVGRVWEETEVIVAGIRKIRDLVEFGRVQNYADFDPDDSEEEVIKKDEVIRQTLYSTLLFHANGLITVLGEFLECVSGIQRLVGTLKTQRTSMDYERETRHGTNALSRDYSIADEHISMAEFIADEPRPIKVLDHNLARKLKRKTKFKKIAEKVRRSVTDFAKRSTTSLLTIFPPLGDGTNEGFLDLYSDGEYDSDYVAGTEITESIYDDEDTYSRTLSPPASPGVMLDKYRQRHRRLSSNNSSGPLEQYWPGSIKLGTSDDNQSPVKVASDMILGPHDMAIPDSLAQAFLLLFRALQDPFLHIHQDRKRKSSQPNATTV
ncbi:hypothetical protein BGZ59_009183 [Podila verticillata]|nr:hypothetical protein BGZ59_009183 [Podila verticillata]